MKENQTKEMLHRVFLLTMLESRARPGRWTTTEIAEIEKNIIDYVFKTTKGGK
jgi:hypothetical protein